MAIRTSLKSASLLLLLATMTCMALWRMPVTEARGPLQCPRMIDCNSVCQGFPWHCVDGKCICDGGNTPPQQSQGTLQVQRDGEQQCKEHITLGNCSMDSCKEACLLQVGHFINPSCLSNSSCCCNQ